MKTSTLIEVITPFGEGMFHWNKMNRPFHIGSSITCHLINGGIEIHVESGDQTLTKHKISNADWLNGHEFCVADDFKIKFKGNQFQAKRHQAKDLEWNDYEIGKSGFFAAALMMGLATYLLPKEDHQSKITEVEEIATIRLTTGESGLVAFSEPEKKPDPMIVAEPPVAEVTQAVAPAPEPVITPAPGPEKKIAPVAKKVVAAPKKITQAPAAPAPVAPAPVQQAFSSKNSGNNQAGASVAKAPVPNAAALLLSRRMASLQKGLQKVMTTPTGSDMAESTETIAASPGQSSSQKTSSLANSISASEGNTGGSVYNGMKTQGIGVGVGVAGTRALSNGNNFEVKKEVGQTAGTGIQLVQTSTPQVSGGELSVAIIQKTFQKNSYQLRNCYEAANITTASIKMNLEFTITPGGTVQGQKFLQGPDRQPASMEQKRLETCILNQMTRWKFETGQMKSSVVIEYPLTFRSLATGDE